ncbi:sulfurtransferase TusA family protein [Oryzifoliimicrobium ureilyticus]|uniref:sulfurtransferase TusA family protein n=1 Tax=Oryzifoliimicrobium ureilyticus TaxID=3113724 RepID=UPI003F673265
MAECDLKGLKCPLPALKTRKRLKSLVSGAVLRVETTDPLAGIDIPHLCQQDGHQLLSSERTANGHVFMIQKGSMAGT